jgi:hypothetical protein
VLPRNQYTAIRDEKPKSKEEAKRPEFKVCKFTTDAIIAEGSEVGTVHKVCANPTCPVHHPGITFPSTRAEQLSIFKCDSGSSRDAAGFTNADTENSTPTRVRATKRVRHVEQVHKGLLLTLC